MAIEDFLNSDLFGSMSAGDAINSAIDLYDIWQRQGGSNSSIDQIVGGYNQGIDYLKDTADESKNLLGDLYNQQSEWYSPYISAGQTSMQDYMNLMQNPETIMEDPAAKWRYDMGMEAVQRGLQQAGYADPMGSGANPIGITDYAQGFASQELDRALERRKFPVTAGLDATRLGTMAAGDYGRGVTGINQYMGPAVANMYAGRADALATKDLIDSMAQSAMLKGGTDILSAIKGDPNVMDLVKQALGGAATSDGVPLMELIGETFGFDPSDSKTIKQIGDALGISLGDITDMDWGNWLGIDALGNGINAMFGDIDFNDLFDGFDTDWSVNWDDLFSWGSDQNGLGAMFSGNEMNWDYNPSFEFEPSWFDNLSSGVGDFFSGLFS